MMDLKAYITKELRDLGLGLGRYLAGLSSEQLSWTPATGAGSISQHLLHAARFEDEFVQRRVASASELWAGLTPSMKAELEAPEPPPETVMSYFEQVRAATFACLRELNELDLDRAVTIPQGEVPTTDALAIVVAHFAQHLGAITYVRRLQVGPAGVEHV